MPVWRCHKHGSTPAVTPRNAFLLTVLLLPGCSQFAPWGAAVESWAVPENVAVFSDTAPQQENEVYSRPDQRVRLEAAVSEVVSFQYLLRADAQATVDSITLDDFRSGQHRIGADQARLYRVDSLTVSDYPAWYLRLTPYLRETRDFPDILIPFTAPAGALPLELTAGRTQPIWVEVRVPPGTEPGLYQSTLRVSMGRGRGQELGVELTVWPFALPQTRHLALLAGLEMTPLLYHHLEVDGQPYAPTRLRFDDPNYTQATAVIDGTIRLLHEHRCSPMLRDVFPARAADERGNVQLDWSDYDRLVGSVIDGTAFDDRASAPAWPLPVTHEEPSPESAGGWKSPMYRRLLTAAVQQSVAHAAERNWLDRHFLWLPLPGVDAYSDFQALGRMVREADPRTRLLCSLPPASMAPYGMLNEEFVDLSELVGIWCPPASLMDPDALAGQLQAGRWGWLWPDRPPFAGSLSAVAPPADARSLAWMAWRYGLSGVLLPNVNDWPEKEPLSATGSESKLIWPGKAYGLSEPVPSVRLKRLLRTAQDYEYLWLLQQNRRPGIARLLAADLVPYGGTSAYGEHLLDGRPHGWASDPTAWSVARRLMARELVAAMEAADATNVDDVVRFERQIEWARLTTLARGLRMDVEGARTSIDDNDRTHPVHVDLTVSMYNATRDVVSGELTAQPLPEGWAVVQPPTTIDRLEPGRRALRILRLRAPSIPSDSEGVFNVGAALVRAGATVSTAPGRVCVLTSQRVRRRPTMDGKLDDWPIGTINVAGDFVLVGARDVPKRDRITPDRASLATSAFITNDSDSLYIAFNCEDDRLPERRITRGNVVRYDELWPAGEDLVEVVLDPRGQALDPGDLLHIVVKANGSVVTERGTPCLASVARHEPWAGGVEAAVDDTSQPGRWTVEIRVPLASLPNPAAVIGINFARYQPRLGEYSCWSGARRYIYSPVTLGGMRLAP